MALAPSPSITGSFSGGACAGHLGDVGGRHGKPGGGRLDEPEPRPADAVRTYSGSLSTIGTLTFTLAGTGANALAVYHVGSGTAAGTAALATTGTGILVPKTGFQAEPFLLVANQQFRKPSTIKAKFTWDPAFTAAAGDDAARGKTNGTGPSPK